MASSTNTGSGSPPPPASEFEGPSSSSGPHTTSLPDDGTKTPTGTSALADQTAPERESVSEPVKGIEIIFPQGTKAPVSSVEGVQSTSEGPISLSVVAAMLDAQMESTSLMNEIITEHIQLEGERDLEEEEFTELVVPLLDEINLSHERLAGLTDDLDVAIIAWKEKMGPVIETMKRLEPEVSEKEAELMLLKRDLDDANIDAVKLGNEKTTMILDFRDNVLKEVAKEDKAWKKLNELMRGVISKRKNKKPETTS